jgi:hypothetical protein
LSNTYGEIGNSWLFIQVSWLGEKNPEGVEIDIKTNTQIKCTILRELHCSPKT